MLKTNSKVFTNKIDNYIKETAADYIREQYTEDGETYTRNGRALDLDAREDLATAILDIFQDEKLTHDMQYAAGRVSRFDMFRNWASGLAMGSTFLYYWNICAVDLLGDMLEETAEERARYDESQAAEMLTRVIYNRLTKCAEEV